jgi:hypothetical protein
MSNNAVEAYKNGEKPLSKWTKTSILEAIQKAVDDKELVLECSMDLLKKMPVSALKNVALSYSSWHHTSNHFNRTSFYSLDIWSLCDLTDERIEEIIANSKEEKKQEKPVEER